MKIIASMIMKDEELVIERCIKAFYDLFDKFVIVDTGSTDKSIEICKQFDKVQLEHFEWCNDFSKARNYSLEKALELAPDWIAWLDCDDIMFPENIATTRQILAKLKEEKDVQGIYAPYILTYDVDQITGKRTPTFKYARVRFFKPSSNPVWIGKIHEYIKIEGQKVNCPEIEWYHKKEKVEKDRNLGIFKTVDISNYTGRDLYYYGKECMFHNYIDEAIKAYEKYLPLSNYKDEYIDACSDLCDCYLSKSDFEKAKEVINKGFEKETQFPGLWLKMAKIYYLQHDYDNCIKYASKIPNLPPYRTLFFDDVSTHTFLPYEYLQCSYFFKNDYENTEKYTRKLLEIKPMEEKYLTNFKELHLNCTIGVIVPTLDRIESLMNLIKSIRENAYLKYVIYVGVDGNQTYANSLVSMYGKDPDIKIILFSQKSTVPFMVEKLIDIAEQDGMNYVTFLGDDTEILKGAFIHAYIACQQKYLVCYNDRVRNGELALHWFAPINLRKKLGGYFFYTGYFHNYCDNELTEKTKELGLYTYAENAYINHNHFLIDCCSDKSKVSKKDKCYTLAFDPQKSEADRKLYLKRKINNWK